MVGIRAHGGYIPRLRLTRKAIVGAHVWAEPGLAGRARGERSICNWDEDPVTMAVEAARDCLSDGRARPDAVYFASTSAPFGDRQHAGIVAAAIGLPDDVGSVDIAQCQRAGTSALLQALGAVAGGLYREALVVASDQRRTRAASAAELAYGDGAAALLVTADDPALRFIAGHTLTVDFVDHFRAAGESFDYGWEERWIRDEGLARIVPAAVGRALAKAGVEAAQVKRFVMPTTIAKAADAMAKAAGIAASAVHDNLEATVGETGTAHPLVMLAHALEGDLAPGDIVVVVGFGQGADVLVFEATERVGESRVGQGIRGSIANRAEENNYQKYLAFRDLIEREKGMRAEAVDYKTALSVAYRRREMLTALVGGRCTRCGTPQFPRTDICVNPQCGARDSQEPYAFRDEPATVLTWSADYLTYIPNPPSHYGMITFDNGGRFMTDFTDIDVGELGVGMAVRMMFRVKSRDGIRGFVRYFWKAVPVRSAA